MLTNDEIEAHEFSSCVLEETIDNLVLAPGDEPRAQAAAKVEYAHIHTKHEPKVNNKLSCLRSFGKEAGGVG